MKIRQATKEGSIEVRPGGLFDSTYPSSKSRRGRVQGEGLICPTLTCKASTGIIRYTRDGRFRKLTERECFRLQGVSEKDIDKIQASSAISSDQQYVMAGNSICVDVLVGIFKNLIQGCEKPEDYLF